MTKIVIDSGAFSAWRLKKQINLDEYCKFLERNSDWISHYVNLDSIRPEDPELAAQESYDNLVLMKKRGFDPIPVWHVREDVSWLDRMLDLGCKYIGFSATSIDSKASIDSWYELAFSRIVDLVGNPSVSTHAFGDGREIALMKFPWTSADSSTWLNGQRHGTMYLPGKGRVTHKKKIENSKAAPDIELLEGENLEIFNSILDSIGLSKEAFFDRTHKRSWLARLYVMACYFKDLEKRVRNKMPIHFVQPFYGFFDSLCHNNNEGIEQSVFDCYLAVGTNYSTMPALYIAGHTNMLASFFYIGPKWEQHLKQYYYDKDNLMHSPPYDKFTTIFEGFVNQEQRNLTC